MTEYKNPFPWHRNIWRGKIKMILAHHTICRVRGHEDYRYCFANETCQNGDEPDDLTCCVFQCGNCGYMREVNTQDRLHLLLQRSGLG
jgi:hypothetical protein